MVLHLVTAVWDAMHQAKETSKHIWTIKLDKLFKNDQFMRQQHQLRAYVLLPRTGSNLFLHTIN
jgi:hypothetical protein